MGRIKQKIVSISQNKEARTLASNFAWLSVLQVVSYIFPLITMPYLARVIGTTGFGKIAFASAIMIWIQTIADWGFNLTATRDVAQNRDDKQRVSEIFSNVLWARCVLMLLSFAVLALLILFIPQFYENRLVILITFLMIPGHILFPDWFFQAVERMKYITLFNVVIKLLFMVAVFVFVKDKDDYILQPLFTSIGYVLCGIISLYLIIGKWGVKLHRPTFRGVYTTIKGSTNVFINTLVPNLYNSLSIVLLGVWSGSYATGIFDGGNKFTAICQQVMDVFSRVFFPFLSRRSDRHIVYVKLSMVISLVMGVGLFVVAPYIVGLFLSSEFVASVVVIKLLALSLPFLALSNSYGTNYLIVHKRERLLRNITFVSSLIGLSLGLVLIPRYSYIGAAVTILITRAILGIVTCVAAKKKYKI